LTGLPVITSDSWAASDCEYRLSGRKAQPLEYFLTRSHLSRYDCILSIGSDFLYLETICCQLNPQAKFVLYLQERVLIDIANEAFESILGNNKVEIFRDISAKKIQNIITRNTLVLIHIDQFSSEVIHLFLSHLDPFTLLMYGSSELGENIFRDDRRLWWRTRDGSKASEPETFWYLSISLNVAD
jgi:hypothetical protein